MMADQSVKGVSKWSELKGQRAQLQRKGFSDTDHGVVSDVNDEHVSFAFDGGGVIYVPVDQITDLTEEKEPSPKLREGVPPDGAPTHRARAEGETAANASLRDETATVPPPGDAQVVEKAIDDTGHVTNVQRRRTESEATDRRQQPAKEDVDVGPVRDPEAKEKRLERATEDEKPFKEWPDTPAHPHQPMEVDRPERRPQKAVGESIRRPAEAQVGEPVQKVFEREERQAKKDERSSQEKATEKRKGE